MPEIQPPFEAEIVHDLPDDIAALIGRIVVTYAKLEHKLSMLAGLILQLNKAEVRIALRMPRAIERLEMVLDLFAVKDIHPEIDIGQMSEAITRATANRDLLAHSLWLRHPETGELYVRMTRGSWPKDLTLGEKVTRAVYPQSIPYSAAECRVALEQVEAALASVDALGEQLDDSLRTFPERFREPSPVLNPLGRRKSPSNLPTTDRRK